MQQLDEMILMQQKKLLRIANHILPHLTTDDILQPNDFPVLDAHPEFRFEEGFLKGLESARAALRADLSSSLRNSIDPESFPKSE
ncbi:MAG: hypothetical protein WDZ28_05250 [Simkaniaceae bacterium]